MEVIKCGTKVILSILENMEGIITSINIRFNKVSYEVSYFYNGDYKQVWLDECEFTIKNIEESSCTKIGFRN